MPINVLMPALSPTMEEGTLAKWLLKEGDRVVPGSVLAEIETDKATMEFEAVDEGTLGMIVVPEGTEGVKVNDLIAVIFEEGEASDSLSGAERKAAPVALVPATPPAPATSLQTPALGQSAQDKDRLFASPLARRVAHASGIDLASIRGTGPNGRIVKADVEAAQTLSVPVPAATRSETTQPVRTASSQQGGLSLDQIKMMYVGREYKEIKLDGMRRIIAERLTEAKQTIPHFYLRREIRLDKLLEFRSQLNKELEPRGIKISVNDFIVKASAIALQQVPSCNAVWAEDRVFQLKASDIAVAVAIAGGLMTPVLRDADKKSLSALSAEMKELANRAKSRKLAPHEYQGGSYAISNLGMMGVESFDAVINPPHASILAVGAAIAKPVVGSTGTLEIATVLSVTLSVDHRIIDGAIGAGFLQALATNLEHPIAMLV